MVSVNGTVAMPMNVDSTQATQSKPTNGTTLIVWCFKKFPLEKKKKPKNTKKKKKQPHGFRLLVFPSLIAVLASAGPGLKTVTNFFLLSL